MLEKIISGGQTGADRAALDAALERGFPCGGYCPAGREAEDGIIDARYPLVEIEGGYRQRTKLNAAESDVTAIFYESELTGGTRLTLEFCFQLEKPFKLIDTSLVKPAAAAEALAEFVATHDVKVLNVAGPRASKCPGMHDYVLAVIGRLLDKR